MSNLKVEGKVGDFCPKCKNCKCIVQEYNGKTASIRLTRVECEDPYDGMTKTLDADSDICCSMFEMKSEKSCDKISLLQHELEMDKLRRKIRELEKEKDAHLKGIERLKKSQEKLQNQVKNLQTTNEESYKREEKLEDKVHKLERRLLEDIKLLNKSGEKCISRGNDIDHLLSENKELKGRVKYWSDIATNSAGQIVKFKQTISDQEVTIKALLITIKEMCKEDETNE